MLVSVKLSFFAASVFIVHKSAVNIRRKDALTVICRKIKINLSGKTCCNRFPMQALTSASFVFVMRDGKQRFFLGGRFPKCERRN